MKKFKDIDDGNCGGPGQPPCNEQYYPNVSAARKSKRKNPDGTESTHVMRREWVDGKGWVAFPSLFQDEDGTWQDFGEKYGKNWEPILEEATKRNEVYTFGEDLEGAINFADKGAWKPENMKKQKLANGGTVVKNYLINPQEALAENAINMAKAKAAGMSDPLATGFKGLGAMGMSWGMQNGGMDALGSMVKQAFAMGGVVQNQDVLLDAGEVIETPDGGVTQLGGDQSKKDGIEATVPTGTKVFSDRVVGKDGKTMAERKTIREKQLAKLQKLMEKKPGDRTLKNTLKRLEATAAAEEAEDMKIQEVASAQEAGTNAFAYGTGPGGVNPVSNTGNPWIDNAQHLSQLFKHTPDMLKAFQRGDSVEGGPNTLTSNAPEGKVALNDTPSPIGTGSNPAIDFAGLDKELASITSSGGLTPSERQAYNTDLKTNEGFSYQMDLNLDGDKPMFSDAETGKVQNGPAQKNPDLLDANSFGNMVGLAGNLYNMFGLKQNTENSRATDVAHKNEMKGFADEALKSIDNSKGFAQEVFDNTRADIQRQSLTAKKAGRNNSRGVNTMRAMDLATDQGTNKAMGDAQNALAQTMMRILGQEGMMKLQKGQGEAHGQVQANMANEAQKDAYYTAKSQNIADIGEGLQQTGKDLNQVQQQNLIAKMMHELSKYGITFDKNGNRVVQNKQTSE